MNAQITQKCTPIILAHVSESFVPS